MRKNLLILLLSLAGLLPTIGNAAETARDKTEREAAENKMTRMKEKLRRQNVAIRFYGKVQDQLDQPVEGQKLFCTSQASAPTLRSCSAKPKKSRQNGLPRALHGRPRNGAQSLRKNNPERRLRLFVKAIPHRGISIRRRESELAGSSQSDYLSRTQNRATASCFRLVPSIFSSGC